MTATVYLIIKSLHIVSFISWMAGMFYLPRLFVYHAKTEAGSEASEMLKVMERKLLRYIINPAMAGTWLFGLILAYELQAWHDGWFHAKMGLVISMTAVHHILARHRKDFDRDANNKSEKYYRILNEIPTILMVAIVFLVVLKPF